VNRFTGGLPLATVLALAAPACTKNTTTPTTTTPPATRTTDTFTGTVPVAGSAFHSFPVSKTGLVEATLTAAGPPSTIVLGLGLGAPGDSRCVPFAGASASAPAGTTPQISGTISPGTLCVEVHDIGNETAPVSYTVTVTHP
jgi:hypothetical protein